MKTSRSSVTAEQMALSRAIETRKPPAERICNDPVAERFLSGAYRLLLLGRPLRNVVEQVIEKLFAGHHYYVIARTRYIDDFLQKNLNGETRQLVILGAGYDSRACRFADRLRDVAVFEVDHPATSQAKKFRIQGLPAAAAMNVTYVPVDFNVDRLGDKLTESGYRDHQKTAFLWEGVTPYVSAEGVDEVLRFIVSSSAKGSALLFDYILKAVVAGTCPLRGASKEFEKMKGTSEPFVFGIDGNEIESFLSARGFGDVVDVGAEELTDLYFRDGNQGRYVKPWWRIVHAAVL